MLGPEPSRLQVRGSRVCACVCMCMCVHARAWVSPTRVRVLGPVSTCAHVCPCVLMVG